MCDKIEEMKQYVVAFISLICILFFPQLALADESWVIENFNSTIAVQQSGMVQVVETISVDYRAQLEHGFYRDIPTQYVVNGKQINTEVVINKVLQNNVPAKYETTQINGYEVVAIGNPDQTYSGRQIYTISYTVIGIIQGVNNQEELHWNVTGNNWSVQIQKVEATVTLPNGGMTKIKCLEGTTGSQVPCLSNLTTPQSATFLSRFFLGDSQGISLDVSFTNGMVPLLTTHKSTFWEKLIQWPSITAFIGVLLIGLGGNSLLWYKTNRDYWLSRKKKKSDSVAEKKVAGEITPPNELRPGEIGLLLDDKGYARAIAVTIIDLSIRGYFTISENSKRWRFGEKDYLFTKIPQKNQNNTAMLFTYERVLYDALFYKRSKVKVSHLQKTFYENFKQVQQALSHELFSKKIVSFEPTKVRKNNMYAAIFLLVFGIGLWISSFHNEIIMLASVGIGLIINGIMLLIIFRFLPQKTAYGQEMYSQSKNYQLYLETSDKFRKQFLEQQNRFNSYLPYVIVFGLSKKFINQTDKIKNKASTKNWFIGMHPYSTKELMGNVDAFCSIMGKIISR